MNCFEKEKIKPLVSLCIPSDGTAKWIKPVLDSIYSQGVDNTLFEVIITNNGKRFDLEETVESYKKYPNLRYYRSEYEGFTNQIFSIKQANGVFRKMINHRSCILPGKLSEIINLVNEYKETRPIIYFSDAKICNKLNLIECKNYDELISNLHYWISWRAGLGVWDNDVPNLDQINPNKIFPHISMIMDVRNESKCLIWNEQYQTMVKDTGKGGYNVFHAFAVTLLNILKDYLNQQKISDHSYEITKQALFRFLVDLYYAEVLSKTDHTFDLSNIKDSIRENYSTQHYLLLVGEASFLYVIRGIKKLINSFKILG